MRSFDMKRCFLGGSATMLGLLLSGCGGGGGVASTPAPTNASLTNLQYSQSFTNDADTATVAFDLTTKTGISGSSGGSTLTIHYDAPSQSYTLTVDGRTQSFAPADIDTAHTDAGSTAYFKHDGVNLDHLTLFKTLPGQTHATQYVAQGFWQRNVVSGSRQDAQYSAFTYGIPSPASAIPRSGTAAYSIDTFGFASKPGQEPISFFGNGSFSVDFAAGVFSAQAFTTETKLVSGNELVGGGLDLMATGRLSSSDGTFSGTAAYQGQLGIAGGPLAGRFYGPSAQELGASFAGTGADGLAVAGSFTGSRDTTLTPDNLTLTNLTHEQRFFARLANNGTGVLDWQNAETFTYAPPTTNLYAGQFTSADKIASADPNFTAYRKTLTGPSASQDVRLELYKLGAGNSELALTYLSLGHWGTAIDYGAGPQPIDQYFVYGLATPEQFLAVRTGSAHYQGVVYGIGDGGATRYAITGSAHFDADFSAQSYSGGLSLSGAPKGGGGSVNFGSYDFSAGLASGQPLLAAITQSGQTLGQINPVFYGPNAQEIGAPFSLQTPSSGPAGTVAITGVTVAKR
jgi:hypothetical protein